MELKIFCLDELYNYNINRSKQNSHWTINWIIFVLLIFNLLMENYTLIE